MTFRVESHEERLTCFYCCYCGMLYTAVCTVNDIFYCVIICKRALNALRVTLSARQRSQSNVRTYELSRSYTHEYDRLFHNAYKPTADTIFRVVSSTLQQNHFIECSVYAYKAEDKGWKKLNQFLWFRKSGFSFLSLNALYNIIYEYHVCLETFFTGSNATLVLVIIIQFDMWIYQTI